MTDLLRREPELAALALLMDRTFDDLRRAGEDPRSASRSELVGRADLWDNISPFGAACLRTRAGRRRAARARWRLIGAWTGEGRRRWVEAHLRALDGGPRLEPAVLLGPEPPPLTVSLDYQQRPRHYGQPLTSDVVAQMMRDYAPDGAVPETLVEVEGVASDGLPEMFGRLTLCDLQRRFPVPEGPGLGRPGPADLVFMAQVASAWDVLHADGSFSPRAKAWRWAVEGGRVAWELVASEGELRGEGRQASVMVDDQEWYASRWWGEWTEAMPERSSSRRRDERRAWNRGYGRTEPIATALRALMMKARRIRFPELFSPRMLREVGTAGAGAALALAEATISTGRGRRGSFDQLLARVQESAGTAPEAPPHPLVGSGQVFTGCDVRGARLRRAGVRARPPAVRPGDDDGPPTVTFLSFDLLDEAGAPAVGHLGLTRPVGASAITLGPTTLGLAAPIVTSVDADGVRVDVPLVAGTWTLRAREGHWWVA